MGIFGKIFGGKGEAKESAGISNADKTVLLEKIRQSDLFKEIPKENIDKMYELMEVVNVASGDVIIREGDEGDYYYLLAKGAAKVSRTGKDGKQQVLAELDEPKGIGEEALISNAKRNATVTMTSAGVVLRLSKDAFDENIKEPLVEWFSPSEAQAKVSSGARWLDVRDTATAKQNHLHGAVLIPLEQIRERSSELDKGTLYVCYCLNGRQSSTAAFLLRQRAFNVGVLRGGLQSLQRAGIV